MSLWDSHQNMTDVRLSHRRREKGNALVGVRKYADGTVTGTSQFVDLSTNRLKQGVVLNIRENPKPFVGICECDGFIVKPPLAYRFRHSGNRPCWISMRH